MRIWCNQCDLCSVEVINGEEICIGPAEHICEDIVVCMDCIDDMGIDKCIRIAEESRVWDKDIGDWT